MALIDAGIAMKDFVCACSSSLIEDTTVVGMNLLFSLPFIIFFFFSDLNYLEESARGPTLTVATLPKSGKIVLLQVIYTISCHVSI